MSYFPYKTDASSNAQVAAGSSFPTVPQTATSKSTGSVASLTATLTPKAVGDMLVLVCAVGNATTPTITDGVGNVWLPAGTWTLGPASAFGLGVFFAIAKSAASTVVTVNNGGATASIAMTLYDTVGLQIGGFDTYSFGTGTSGAPSSGATIGNFAPEYAFGGIAVGSAAETVTVAAGSLGFANDSGQQNPTTPAGLYSFVAGSALCQAEANATFAGTMTSQPWVACIALFRVVGMQVAGTVALAGQNNLTKAITPVTVDPYGSVQTVIAGQASDAFGRVRTADPVSLFDAQFQYDLQPLLFQNAVVGTGSVVKTTGEASLTLSTGGTTIGASAINQTKAYFRYEPGKSQQILMTGILGAKIANVRSDIGYFDDNDGVFFRMDGTVGMSVVLRSSVPGLPVTGMHIALVAGGTGYAVGDTGTINTGGANATYQVTAVATGVVTAVIITGVGTGYTTGLAVATTKGGAQAGSGTGMTVNVCNESSVPQAQWNVDTFGAGPLNPSGITLDPTKGQIFCVDFQWLGVGRVRYGFFMNGVLTVAHQIFNANGVIVPYMNTANLPCRAKIWNTGTAAGTNTMKQICMAVVSEGGIDTPQAYQYTASATGTSFAGVSAANGTRTALVAIQPKLTFNSIVNRGRIIVTGIEVFVTGAAPAYWELIYNPTTASGGSYTSVDNNSLVNFNAGITSVALTAGTSVILAAGFAGGGSGSAKSGIQTTVGEKFPLTLDITGAIPDTILLCATGVAAGATVYGNIIWTEVR